MFAKSLPSFFTIANLFLGIVAIIFIFDNRPDLAAMMIIIAMVTDGLDGRVARALNVQSEFGKELDSLSDVISFGVAPAFMLYSVAFQQLGPAGWLITAIFPICGALRLARFNVLSESSRSSDTFIGLPIPAAGGVLATLGLFHQEVPVFVLMICTILLSLLMISNVRYPSFKKRGLSKKAKVLVPIIVILAVVLSILYQGLITKLLFIPLVLYALYGLKKNISSYFRLMRRKRKRTSFDDPMDVAK